MVACPSGGPTATTDLQSRPEGQQRVHEVACHPRRGAHADVHQHGPVGDVAHDGLVVPLEAVEVLLVSQEDVGLQAVLVVGVDACEGRGQRDSRSGARGGQGAGPQGVKGVQGVRPEGFKGQSQGQRNSRGRARARGIQGAGPEGFKGRSHRLLRNGWLGQLIYWYEPAPTPLSLRVHSPLWTLMVVPTRS